MAIKVEIGRQWPLRAVMEFTYADLNNAVVTDDQKAFFDLPPNSIVVGGELIVTSAWVGPTAATLDVGDLASGTRYGANIDLKTAARTALTLTGFKNTAWEQIVTRLSQTVAAATAGAAILMVEYVSIGRVTENT